MRVEKREFAREFSQLLCAGQTRMRVDHSGRYPVTDITVRVAGTILTDLSANKACKFF